MDDEEREAVQVRLRQTIGLTAALSGIELSETDRSTVVRAASNDEPTHTRSSVSVRLLHLFFLRPR